MNMSDDESYKLLAGIMEPISAYFKVEKSQQRYLEVLSTLAGAVSIIVGGAKGKERATALEFFSGALNTCLKNMEQ